MLKLNRAQKRFVIASLLMVLAIGGLIYTAVRSNANYYYTVCEAKSLTAFGKQRSLRLEGKVVEGSLIADDQKLNLLFRLKEDPTKNNDCTESILVSYSGVTPDLMQEAITVVVEGNFADDGSFIAKRLLTSCPSRYDAAKNLKS